MPKEYLTKSFTMGDEEISFKLIIPDDLINHKKDIEIIPMVNGKEKIIFCGLDPAIEAAAIIAIDNFFEDVQDDSFIHTMLLDKIVDYIKSVVEKAMFNPLERDLLMRRLLIHYDFIIRHKRAQIYRGIRKGLIKPVRK